MFLTPIIAYGTYVTDYHRNVNSGIDDFLTIPISEDHLHKVVTRWSRRASVNPHLLIEKQNKNDITNKLLKLVEDLKTMVTEKDHRFQRENL